MSLEEGTHEASYYFPVDAPNLLFNRKLPQPVGVRTTLLPRTTSHTALRQFEARVNSSRSPFKSILTYSFPSLLSSAGFSTRNIEQFNFILTWLIDPSFPFAPFDQQSAIRMQAQLERHPQAREHQQDADLNHPSLSSVPLPPGPELDPKHHPDAQAGRLPQPPIFSPPSTNTTLDDISFGNDDDEIEPLPRPVHHPDFIHQLSPRSPQNISGFIVEPQTPETLDPHLDFIPSVTTDFEHITQPIGTIDLTAKEALPEPEPFDRSESLETNSVDSHSNLNYTNQPEITSIDSQDQLTPPGIERLDSVPSHEEKLETRTRDEPDQLGSRELAPSSKPQDPQLKPFQSAPQNQSQSRSDAEAWFDITKTEVQFALGLFAIPWSSLIFFSRLINQTWAMIFNEPIVRPVSGLIPSMLVPSFLYGSLLALFTTALAQF